MLPEQFIEQLTLSLGPERAGEVFSYIQDSQPSVAVRANPFKVSDAESLSFLPIDAERSTYSQWGRFLTSRPEFALDPLFHAGAYYVQEASSMYLERILPLMAEMRQACPDGAFKVLDLCAAPGGKTTHLLSMLRETPGSFLVSNEVIRTRAAVLCENVSKWGAANVVVTNNDPADFAALPGYFDVMVVDAPCSGEGMFRKDPEAVAQWSEDNVRLCAARQRRILSDVLPALRPGGFLMYSTCTFNHYEDEDNVAWLVSEYGFDVLEQRHFYPGDDMAGEGFFFSLLRKDRGGDTPVSGNASKARGGSAAYRSFGSLDWVWDGFTVYRNVMMSGSAVAEVKDGSKGKLLVLPQYSLIQSEVYRRGSLPEIAVPLETALACLRRDPVVLRDAPVGYVVLTYSPGISTPAVPFGLVKNLGSRCNNLLPPSIALRKR